MKEKIKMILCLCLIIAGLPILMTLVFQGLIQQTNPFRVLRSSLD